MKSLIIPNIIPSVNWYLNCQMNGYWISEKNTSNYYWIAGPNSLQKLQIPIQQQSKLEVPNNRKISYNHKWIAEHKNAWKTAYGKSPFYEYYDYRLHQILDSKIETIGELSQTLLNTINPLIGGKSLEITTKNPVVKELVDPYYQVFEDRYGFRQPVSILDLLFNLGPMSSPYLESYRQ